MSLWGQTQMVSAGVAETAALSEMRRVERICRAWQAYYGDIPGPFKRQAGKPDDNITLNYERLIVDTGVSALFGHGVDFDVSNDKAKDGAKGKDSPEQQWLDAVWRANRQDTLLHRLALNGAVAGHAWIQIVEQSGKPPRLVVLDPGNVSVRHSPIDYEDVIEYQIQWTGIDPGTGKPCAYRRLITSQGTWWLMTDQESRGDDARWTTTLTAEWRRPWAPILGCQNLPAPNVYWGTSDLEADVTSVVRAMDFVMSNMARILRYHAHPKTIGTGINADELNAEVDGFTAVPSPDAKVFNLEMSGDLGSSLEFYKALLESMHELSRVPVVATGKVDGIGALSGVALEVLYRPLMEKSATKRLTYGDMLEELCCRILEMGGFTGVAVEIRWPDLLPKDTKAELEAAIMAVELGSDRKTQLERLGYEADEVWAAKLKEDQQLADAQAQAIDNGGLPQ